MNATNTILLIAATGLALTIVKWTFLPDRRLPRHRVRHMRIRLKLRLHCPVTSKSARGEALTWAGLFGWHGFALRDRSAG